MANITYSNADNKYKNYGGGNSGTLTLDRQRLAILNMMQKDPQMTAGYLIGNAIGKKYWGDKQAKSRAEADFMTRYKDANRDQFNQYYKAIKSGMSQNDALAQAGLGPNAVKAASPEVPSTWDDKNKALDEIMNNGNGGKVYASGTPISVGVEAPKTPVQQGQAPITMENAANMGGMTTPEMAYQKMAAAPFNNGNTPLAKADINGVRDLANIMPAVTPQAAAAGAITPELAALGANGLGASALTGLGGEAALAGLGGEAALAGLGGEAALAGLGAGAAGSAGLLEGILPFLAL